MTDVMIRVRGSLSIPKSSLSPEELKLLRLRLTLMARPLDGDPYQVRGYTENEEVIEIPRHFREEDYRAQIGGWDWVCPPLDVALGSKMTLKPSREQPQAVAAMVEHIRRHNSGILVAPTGTGKTLCALAIAQQFQTPIAVFVYAAHMIENWVNHVVDHYGLSEHDVGVIGASRRKVGSVTIVFVQTVTAGNMDPALFERFGFLIADEVHRHGSPVWHQVMGRFAARYRLGVSADPTRCDGLQPLIHWTFGDVGYSVKEVERDPALTCLYKFPARYEEHSYRKLIFTDGHVEYGDTVDPQRYDRLLARDKRRNAWLIKRIIEARSKGRSVLVFSRFRNHLQGLCSRFIKEWGDREPKTRAATMLGGARNKTDREHQRQALTADVNFTTYSYARDAMNAPHLDTLIFATPPGNPRQPAGRLRDNAVPGKQKLLILDPYEPNPYSTERAHSRAYIYRQLGYPIQWHPTT